MSRNELRVIARIMLIGVGLYVLLQTVLGILTSVPIMLTVARADAENTTIITSFAVYVMLVVAAVYFLVRCANRFSAKIVEAEPAEDAQVSWLAAAFRLVCVTAGVLFIYWSVPGLIVTLSMYMSVKPGQQIYMPSSKADIVKYVVMLGLSIYLACGAPGFVRWQVKKTLEQCRKIDITP